MIRDIVAPERSGFLLLRALAGALTVVGILIVLATLIVATVTAFSDQAPSPWRMDPVRLWFLALVVTGYGIALMVAGQLLHWLVAIWRAQRERARAAVMQIDEL